MCRLAVYLSPCRCITSKYQTSERQHKKAYRNDAAIAQLARPEQSTRTQTIDLAFESIQPELLRLGHENNPPYIVTSLFVYQYNPSFYPVQLCRNASCDYLTGL
jgi:hypothetical protein